MVVPVQPFLQLVEMLIELRTGIFSWDLERGRKPEQENHRDGKAHHVEYEEAPETPGHQPVDEGDPQGRPVEPSD